MTAAAVIPLSGEVAETKMEIRTMEGHYFKNVFSYELSELRDQSFNFAESVFKMNLETQIDSNLPVGFTIEKQNLFQTGRNIDLGINFGDFKKELGVQNVNIIVENGPGSAEATCIVDSSVGTFKIQDMNGDFNNKFENGIQLHLSLPDFIQFNQGKIQKITKK